MSKRPTMRPLLFVTTQMPHFKFYILNFNASLPQLPRKGAPSKIQNPPFKIAGLCRAHRARKDRVFG
jgi:hypothetical protein